MFAAIKNNFDNNLIRAHPLSLNPPSNCPTRPTGLDIHHRAMSIVHSHWTSPRFKNKSKNRNAALEKQPCLLNISYVNDSLSCAFIATPLFIRPNPMRWIFPVLRRQATKPVRGLERCSPAVWCRDPTISHHRNRMPLTQRCQNHRYPRSINRQRMRYLVFWIFMYVVLCLLHVFD